MIRIHSPPILPILLIHVKPLQPFFAYSCEPTEKIFKD